MKLIKTVSRMTGYLASGIFWALMLLTVADVLLRYTINKPITGTTELSKMMMLCLALSMGWCAIECRHIKIDILMDRVSPRVQAIVESITLVIALCMAVILSWRIFMSSLSPLSEGIKSSTLGVFEFPFYWVLALSYAILSLAMITVVTEKIAGVIKNES